MIILYLPLFYYYSAIFRNLIKATYYLEEFKHIFSLVNVFTLLNNEISFKDSIKTFFVSNYCFPSYSINQTRALEKQQRDTLLADHLEIEGLGIYFAEEPYRPQVTISPLYIEVLNFLWISAVLPVS